MKRKKLGGIFRITSGGTPNRINKEFFENGTIPWIKTGDLKSKYVEGPLEQITEIGLKGSSAKLFPANTVLIAMYGATIGNCSIMKFEASTNQACAAFLPNTDVNEEYLYYFLKSIQRKLVSRGQGGGQPNISATLLKEIEIPLPDDFDDQIRIAILLSRVEALIGARKENLRLLDEFLKSTFLKMFGAPVRNEKGFEMRTLSEFYIDSKNGTKCGPFGSALKKEEYVNSGVPVWNMDNISTEGRFNPKIGLWITDKKFEKLKVYSAMNGDVIISRAGTVGKMCVLNSKYPKSIISTNLIRVRLGEELLPGFFVSLMTYYKGRVGNLRTGADGSFTHMNTGILDKLHFPYPPIKLQNQYASVVEKAETLRSVYQKSLTELENLYGALSQKAFKGELDLTRIPLEQELEPRMDANERKLESGAPSFAALDQGAMSDPAARERVLRSIVEGFFRERPRRTFSFKDFWSRVEFNVLDHMDDESPPLGVEDYNKIKQWLFERLKSSQVEQHFNTSENQLELRTKP